MNGNKILKSASIIMVLAVVCKGLGFLREVLTAQQYGAGMSTDAYFLASNIITTLSTISIPIASTVIPMLMSVQERSGKEGKKYYTANLTNIVFVVTSVVVILGAVLTPAIVNLMAYGFTQEQHSLTVCIVRIGLPAIVLSAILGVFRGYLQSEGKFADTAFSDLILNFSYIVFLIVLAPFLSIQWMMVTMIVACFFRIALQVVLLHGIGYRHRFILDIKDGDIRTTLMLIVPVFVSSLVNDLNGLIDKSFAAGLDTGTISVLNYASKTNNAIMAIFITSLVTVLFPNLASAAVKGDKHEFRDMVSGGLKAILALTIPATVGLILLVEPVIKLAFERGAFDATASKMTAECLVFYSLGLVGMSLRTYLERAFYSAHDTKTPMINAVLAVIINVVLNVMLVQVMQHRGLALATSIAAITAAIGLIILLRKKVGAIGMLSVTKTGLKALLAALMMGMSVVIGRYISSLYLNNTLLEILILGVTVCVGVIIYVALMILMKEDIFMQGIRMLRSRFSR